MTPDTVIMSSELLWSYKRACFKHRVGEHMKVEPITLRNKFTGNIFWMQS